MSSIRSRRDYVFGAVGAIEGLSCVTPEAAFYAMIRVEDHAGRTDERFVLDLLEETGVLVVHGSGFGLEPTPCHFRLVYLPSIEVLETVFNRLGQFMGRTAAPPPTEFIGR